MNEKKNEKMNEKKNQDSRPVEGAQVMSLWLRVMPGGEFAAWK